jgi:hypothetical protein
MIFYVGQLVILSIDKMSTEFGYLAVIGVKLQPDDFLNLVRRYTELELDHYQDKDDIWEETADDMSKGIKTIDGYTLQTFSTYQRRTYFIYCARSQVFKIWRGDPSEYLTTVHPDQHQIDGLQRFLETAGIDEQVSAYIINSTD